MAQSGYRRLEYTDFITLEQNNKAGGTRMANQEQLAMLRQGVEAWKQWRVEHPYILPDLSGADLHGVDLDGVDLIIANLFEANLNYAKLYKADLASAKLKEATLSD